MNKQPLLELEYLDCKIQNKNLARAIISVFIMIYFNIYFFKKNQDEML